jgi:hypothetical protein
MELACLSAWVNVAFSLTSLEPVNRMSRFDKLASCDAAILRPVNGNRSGNPPTIAGKQVQEIYE